MGEMKNIIKKLLNFIGVEPEKVRIMLSRWSIHASLQNAKLYHLAEKLRRIVPDISQQENTEGKNFDDFIELKRRALQAFQCQLMLSMLNFFPGQKAIRVVDIGDSAGTHMLYLKALAGDNYDIETLSVNLDPRAILKIESRGLKALLSRAEYLDLDDKNVDFFTAFQLLEHLHDPVKFLRNLAEKSNGNKLVVTVPYLRQSRVGLHGIRQKMTEERFAEDEHIFELSPNDWKLLMLHSGWKVIHSRIYYQYPRWPIVDDFLAFFWRGFDFEGFWGAILEKDNSYSDFYRDWEKTS